jgi:hypothetical protein
MLDDRHITLIEKRRDAIRAWLDDAAPYTAQDQRHLDAHTPEQAYWQHGYQAALNDILRMLSSTIGSSSGSEDTSNQSRSASEDAPDSPAG